METLSLRGLRSSPYKFGTTAAVLLVSLLMVPLCAWGGTITGTVQKSNGKPLAGATITMSLSQPGYVGGVTVTTDPIYCGTSATGTVVGVPDPQVQPVVSSNYNSGSLPGGVTYYQVITYTGTSGDSAAGPETAFTMTGSGTLTTTPPTLQPANASGYKVWTGTTPGGEQLQGSVTGWTPFVQSTPLAVAAPAPTVNTTVCAPIFFNDAIIPSYTTYNFNLIDGQGKQVAGYPQRFYLQGSTVDLSTLTPAANVYAKFPNAIVSQPAGSALQSVNGPLSLNGFGLFNVSTITGSPTIPGLKSINGILFGDQYSSIQAAINALPATGGWIYIKPGTYVGPTTIPSHVHLTGYVPGVPAITLNAATNFVLGTVPADQKVIFTYTSNLTLSGLFDTTIEGVTFDFGGNNAGIIMQNGVFENTFDIVIQNTGSSAALTLSGGSVAGQSVAINDFRRLQAYNVGKGIVLTGAAPGASGNNRFGYVIINNIATTGIEFTQQSDTNSFDFVFIAGLANTAGALVFNNSGTPTLDVDANDNVFRHLIIDAFNPPSYTGTLILFNQSLGNLIQGLTIGGGLTGATEVSAPGNPSASYTIEYAADLTHGTNSNAIQAKRFEGSGTLHTGSDFVLSAGWGSTAVKGAISGTDTAGTLSITSNGAGIAANPTVTLTFRDGAWGGIGWGSNSSICVVSRAENSAPATGFFSVTSTTLTQAIFTFFGLPVSGNSYTFDFICAGTTH